MAVTNVYKLHQDQSATKTDDGRREFSVKYLVEVDDPQDGANIVLAAAAVSKIGDAYIFGNDSDSEALCIELAPSRVDGTRLLWTVDATFATEDTETGGPRPGEDGELSDDPEDWREEFDIDTALFSVPVEHAILRTSFSGGRSAGSAGAVTNSANVIFDPPPEAEIANDILRFTKYRLEYPDDLAVFRNAINQDEFSITKPGYGRTFDVYTMRLMGLRASLNYHRTQAGVIVPYWRVYFELHERNLVISPTFTMNWRFQFVDRGFAARAQPGDSDGMGGTYSAIPTGVPHLRALLDPNGEPLSEPSLLNLGGMPLASGVDAKYITYSFLPEKPFSDLNI